MVSFHHISPTTLTNHKNTVVGFSVTLFANLLPMVIGMLGVIAGGTWNDLSQFYGSGEFYIYSTALLGPSCLVFYTYKQKNYDKFSLLFLTSLFIAFVSSFLYALLIVDKVRYSKALSFSSYAILGVTVLIYYYASLTDQAKRAPDVVGQERKGVVDLMNQLGGQ